MTVRLTKFDVRLLCVSGAVVTALMIAAGTLINAPPVGGAWWPYIRVGAALVAGCIGLPIGFYGTLLILLAGAYLGVIG